MHYLYVLQSEKAGKWYIGITRNPTLRLRQHNAGSVRSTKAYRPYRLLHKEQFATVQEARKRELLLKQYGIAYRELRRQLRGPIV